MNKRTLQAALAAALAAGTVGLYAQSTTDTSTPSTATTTTQSEMDKGVPDVDVNVGRNADGAIDVNRANTERAKGVPGVDVDAGRNANGAMDVTTSPQADRDAPLMGSDANTSSSTATGADSSLAPRADRN